MPVVPWQCRSTTSHSHAWRAAALVRRGESWSHHAARFSARAHTIHANHPNGHVGILKIPRYTSVTLSKRVRRLKVVRASSDSDPSSPQSSPPPSSAKPAPAILRPLLALWDSLHGVTLFIASVLDRWYIKALLFMTLFCVGLSLLIKTCLVPYVNRSLLPFASEKAAEVLQREVRIGELEWVSLGGLSGLHPLASISNVYVGPGAEEFSSLKAEKIVLNVDTVQTLLSKQITCKVHASGIELLLVQGSNFTWFGFPRDNDTYHEIGPAGIKPPDHPCHGKTVTRSAAGSTLLASNSQPPSASPSLSVNTSSGDIPPAYQTSAVLNTPSSSSASKRETSASKTETSASERDISASKTETSHRDASLRPLSSKLVASPPWQHAPLPVASISSNIPGGNNNGGISQNDRNGVDTAHHAVNDSLGDSSQATLPKTADTALSQHDSILPNVDKPDSNQDGRHPVISGPVPTVHDVEALHRSLHAPGVDGNFNSHEHVTDHDLYHSENERTDTSNLYSKVNGASDTHTHDLHLHQPLDQHSGSHATSMNTSHPATSHVLQANSPQSHETSHPHAAEAVQTAPISFDGSSGSDTLSEHPSPQFLSTQTAAPTFHNDTTRASTFPDTYAEPQTRQTIHTHTHDPSMAGFPDVTVHGPQLDALATVESSRGQPVAVEGSTAGISSGSGTSSGILVMSDGTSSGSGTRSGVLTAVDNGHEPGVGSTQSADNGRKGIRIFGRRLVAERAYKERHPETNMAEGWQQDQQEQGAVKQAYSSLLESHAAAVMPEVKAATEIGAEATHVEKQADVAARVKPEEPVKPQGFQAVVEDKMKGIAEIVAPMPKEVLPPLAIVTMAKYMVARVLESWQPPTVAVSRVSLSGGTLLAYMEGEDTPRIIEDVEASCKFGRDYHWIDADISGRARARDPMLDKCTMISPKAKRHLRHVTAGAQVGKVRIFQNDELPHDLKAELKDQLWPPPSRAPADARGAAHIESGMRAEAVFSNAQVERSPLVSKSRRQKASPALDGALGVGGANPAWTSSVQSALGDAVEPAVQKGLKHVVISTYKILDRTKMTPQQIVKLGWKTPQATSASTAAPSGGKQGEEIAASSRLPVPAKGSGGDMKVRLTCRNIMVPDRWPDLHVSIKGDNLHGPLIERIIKLPMDIYEGRADGELRIKAFDEETWEFPHFYGKVHCKDVDLHFWDAPDDIHSATMDLLFEKDRMYLHGASGYFGAVPLTVTGDMDLNPDTGTYRLSASVTPVEINALRATLGVRPIPYPCVGGVRGVLHCTGPLEFPLFSGTAVAVRPNADTLAAGEDCAALDALRSTPTAVAAYDKIPVVSASGVFTMDMSSKMFMLHSGHAQPVGGGQLIASGRMWVADEAEEDPRAVRMQGEGQGLDADVLLQHYLPQGVTLPSSIRMGAINVKGTMEGSHVSPVVRVRWDAPVSSITGSAMLSRPLVQASSSGPHFQAAANLTQTFPDFDKMKTANTQAEATKYGAPLITGCDLDGNVAGLDLLQMASSPTPITRMSSGAPVRLKVAASTSLSVRLQDENEPLSFAGTIQLADVRLNQLSLARQLSGHLQLRPSALDITARGLRPDELLDIHLSLPQESQPSAPQPDQPLVSSPPTNTIAEVAAASVPTSTPSGLNHVTTSTPSGLDHVTSTPSGLGPEEGKVENTLLVVDGAKVGDKGVTENSWQDERQSIAGGKRSEEGAAEEVGVILRSDRQQQREEGANRESERGVDGKQERVVGAEISSQTEGVTKVEEGTRAGAETALTGPGTEVVAPHVATTAGLQQPAVVSDSVAPTASGTTGPPVEGEAQTSAPERARAAAPSVGALPAEKPRDSSFVLRRGPLLVSARVNSDMNCGALRLAGMKLDELELASLRGQVGELEVEVDLPKQSGHAHVYIDSPRYSGLQGVGFSSHVRWDGAVLRLEQAVLQQKHSRYELQGEYILPPNTSFPDTAMFAVGPTEASDDGNDPSEQSGFWRVMLTVPQAELEEILPAARLLRRATSVQPVDYNMSKREFLTQMAATSIEAPQMLPQVRSLTVDGQVSKEHGWVGSPSPTPHTASPTPKSVLPGLQELRGRWSGSVQAIGGAGGPTSVSFGVKGQNWKWGSFGLDQVAVAGTAHESEGVQLDELVLRSGEARLSIQGSLLSPKQNATVILHDFPVAMLHPLYRALPALQNAAPAVNALPKKSGNVGNMGPLGAMSQRLEQTVGNLLGKLGGGNTDVTSWAGSPINGQLELKGVLGGSATAPEGQLKVRLYDGAIGAVRLARAEAEMGINSQQLLSMEVDLVPAESAGHLKMVGRMPLLPLGKGSITAAAPNGGAGDEDSMDVRVSVKDGGMSLVTSISPDVCWVGGNAAIELSMRGSVASPQVQGSATLSKASITSPYLKYPVTNVGGTIKVQGSTLSAENLEARVGRQGHVRIKGDLPLTPPGLKTGNLPPSPGKKGSTTSEGLTLDIGGLEVRVRNVFTGSVDAKLQLLRSVDSPQIAGSVRLSRGTAYLIPQGGAGPAAPINPEGGASERDMVAKAFAALKAGKMRSALEEPPVQESGATSYTAPTLAPPATPLTNVYLNKLTVTLGPELRAVFPLVINVGVSGEVELTGPADPASIRARGMFKLENGVINLVATQFNLDRDHPNTITFVPERSLDPEIDVCLLSSDLRCKVQGNSSSWQDHVVLTHRGGGPGTPGEGERVDPEEVARIFEGRLAETLLAEDGQLAFSNLASSTFSTLLPKIETHGQLGKARWRLVSALPIPGLLSLEPSGDATNLLSTLTMGTEVEIQFGKSVQAAMAYKAREAEGSGTEWTLIYQISSKLRLQAQLKSHNPLPTILLQYSSEATTR